MASLDYKAVCVALTHAGPQGRDTFLANLAPLSDPGSMTVDVVMQCKNEVQASATVDLMCAWVPNRTRDVHASNLRRIEAVLTPTNMSYPKVICACSYSRWLATPASLYTTTVCVSVKNVCKKKKGFQTVCGDCRKLRQSAEQKPVQQLAPLVPMEAEQAPPAPQLPAPPQLDAGQPLPMQVEEGGQQGMAEQEQQGLDSFTFGSFALGGRFAFGAAGAPGAFDALGAFGAPGGDSEPEFLDCDMGLREEGGLGGETNPLSLFGAGGAVALPASPALYPPVPPATPACGNSPVPVLCTPPPGKSTSRQSIDKHIAVTEAASAEKRAFERAVRKKAQEMVEERVAVASAELEAHRRAAEAGARAAGQRARVAEKAERAAVAALAKVVGQLQREQQQQIKTDQRKEAAVAAAKAAEAEAKAAAAKARAAQGRAQARADSWKKHTDSNVQKGRDEREPEIRALQADLKSAVAENARSAGRLKNTGERLVESVAAVKKQKLAHAAEVGAAAAGAAEDVLLPIQVYLAGRKGRPPETIRQQLADGPFERKNSKVTLLASKCQGELEDKVHELEEQIDWLDQNGNSPIFVKENGSYPAAAMVMVFEMLTHLDSVVSIHKDLVTMHAHVYPGLTLGEDYTIPSPSTLTEWRNCSKYFTEIITAVRMGQALSWKQLFHDGSSDRQTTSIFSTLAKIEESGGDFVTLLLRGVHIIEGGTAADECDDIRTTIFRMAEKLTCLRNQMAHDKIPAADIDRLVPLPTTVTLLRLVRGSVMSDNAAAAKAVSALLEKEMEKDATEYYDGNEGRPLWSEMDAARRISATRLYLFTCWNHIRNLLCNEAVKAEKAVVRSHIDIELLSAANAAHGRTDAGDVSAMMRAAFKEFAVTVDCYAKGKGNDFNEWFEGVYVKEQASAAELAEGVFVYPLDRLDHGARFDMQLNGAVACLLNSEIWIKFLEYRELANTVEKKKKGGEHEVFNILESSLLASLKCPAMQAALRARVALAMKVNGPLRAMTNSESGGKRRNPLDMAGPCAELWESAQKLEADPSPLYDKGYSSPFAGQPEADSWLQRQMAETKQGFTTGGKCKGCRIWDRLGRLIHTDSAQAPSTIAHAVTKAHARGILISLDRNAADFLPRREFDSRTIDGGVYCLANQTEEMRADCVNMEAVNDCAESSFALFDFICRRCNRLAIHAASGVTQMVMNNDLGREFAKSGWYHSADPVLQSAIFRTISSKGSFFRAQNQQDEADQKRRAVKRAENVRRLRIKKAAVRYIAAKKALRVARTATVAGVDAELQRLRANKSKSPDGQKLGPYLIAQIKIYTHGMQVFPKVAQSCCTDSHVGSDGDLTARLKEMVNKAAGMDLPAEPPLEVCETTAALTLGGAAPVVDATAAAEFRSAVMAEVSRQESGGDDAGPEEDAPAAAADCRWEAMEMPVASHWGGRSVQYYTASGWNTGKITGVSTEGQVIQRRVNPRRGGGGEALAAPVRHVLPAGRVQIEWSGQGQSDGEWNWLRAIDQFPRCKGIGAWRVLAG
jgi:hypothetical protein